VHAYTWIPFFLFCDSIASLLLYMSNII